MDINRFLREIFDVGVVIKAVDSTFEILLGLALWLLGPQAISGIFTSLLGNEIAEQPQDKFWGYIFHHAQGFFSGQSQSLWIFILLSHGITKLFLAIGLLKDKLWAYPASAAVFTFFVAYQTYHLVQQPSLLLEIVTIFDVLLIALVLQQYRHELKTKID